MNKQRFTIKWLLILALIFGFSNALVAQGVTTSGLQGTIIDSTGETLIGANIVAVHLPSGTTYGTSADINGSFRIPNMRVGGPYRITVSYTGFGSQIVENVFLELGETERLTFTLTESSVELDAITVSGERSTVGQSAGASSQISRSEIENLPSLNRNINDYLRTTPQSSGFGGSGITFAGVNNRYNAIYIDGAVNNDVFGLASSGTNGGQTGITPFSIDIIDQLQVVISPYDVTLGGFAGGGVNAVTKSGTNTFEGTAYRFIQNENFVGQTNGTLAERLGVERTGVDEFSSATTGFSLGGPIIENKLFFFTNFELQEDATPRPYEFQTYTNVPGRATQNDLNTLRNYLINTYDYDPGTFGSTSNNLDGTKFFAKLDYNINADNYLTLRHQYTKAELFRRNTGSNSAMNFSNNGVYFPSTTNSSALELNSRFGSDFSNNLILSYVAVVDDRDPIAGDFPFVIIEDGSGGQIRFGSEQFSTGNALDQNIFAITNNFNIYKGDHTITVGTHNEFYSIYNLFIPQNYGTYRFASINDFITNQPATEYDRTYSIVDNITGDGSAAAAEFNAAQFGLYVQDEWRVNESLKLTAGLRLDIPVITSDPEEDTNFNNNTVQTLRASYPIAQGAVAGSAPDGQIMFSPRFGFNYTLDSEKPAVLRGGLGVFTSRIPFVWPGAMFSNNGLTQGRVNEGDITGPVLFRPDIQNQYTNPNVVTPSGQIDLFTQNFKYPQIFRTNLGFDYELPFGILATVEGIYTKTLNNINYTNINSDPTVSFNWTGSPDNRPVYVNQSLDPTYSAVYLASNTSKGYTYNTSISLAKNFNNTLNATVSYSWGDAKALSEGTSSQNSSQWRGQVNVDGRNNPSYGRSDFAAGHRFISALNYTKNWGGDILNTTTLSLFMNAQSGQPFSYIIGGNSARNINGERGSTSRNRSLVYIPATQSDINLVDYTAGGQTVTAAQQWEQLNRFIESDKYLSNNRGGYAEKNGAFAPFTALFDVGVRQDVGIMVGGQRHRLQFSLDIQNVANLLNSDWGVVYTVPGNSNNYFLYQFQGYEADGTTPQFTYRSDETGRESFNISGNNSRWRLRAGVRYIFN